MAKILVIFVYLFFGKNFAAYADENKEINNSENAIKVILAIDRSPLNQKSNQLLLQAAEAFISAVSNLEREVKIFLVTEQTYSNHKLFYFSSKSTGYPNNLFERIGKISAYSKSIKGRLLQSLLFSMSTVLKGGKVERLNVVMLSDKEDNFMPIEETGTNYLSKLQSQSHRMVINYFGASSITSLDDQSDSSRYIERQSEEVWKKELGKYFDVESFIQNSTSEISDVKLALHQFSFYL